MPESPGTRSPAKGTVGGPAAAATAEPARSMHLQPLQTSHCHSRRYLGTWLDRVPRFLCPVQGMQDPSLPWG